MNKCFFSTPPFMTGLLLLLGLFLATCKSVQPVVVAPTTLPLPSQPTDSLVQHLIDQQIDVEWFSAKSKVVFQTGDKKQKATLNIRMRKDSVLWMNVKKLGIEGARILITPDSIYMLDRLNKEYVISDFSLIQDQYHLPANFQLLQNMILGNPLLLSEVQLTTTIDEQTYHLASSEEESPTRDYWLNGLSRTLAKMVFLDYRYNRRVKVELSDYQELDKYPNFSYVRSLELSSPQTGDVGIDINLSKVEINVPKNIRFEIPDHYTRIN